jgi:hypothetical protein
MVRYLHYQIKYKKTVSNRVVDLGPRSDPSSLDGSGPGSASNQCCSTTLVSDVDPPIDPDPHSTRHHGLALNDVRPNFQIDFRNGSLIYLKADPKPPQETKKTDQKELGG